MKEETLVITHKCDFCYKECTPVRVIDMPHSYAAYGQEVKAVQLRVECIIPYAAGPRDICQDCLDELLRKHIVKPLLQGR